MPIGAVSIAVSPLLELPSSRWNLAPAPAPRPSNVREGIGGQPRSHSSFYTIPTVDLARRFEQCGDDFDPTSGDDNWTAPCHTP